MSNDNVEEMSLVDFQDEIAIRLELDLNQDIFDLIDEVSNIVGEKGQRIEICKDRLITLNRLDTSELENVKSIICYYTEVRDKYGFEYTYSVFDDYNSAKNYYNQYIMKNMEDWYKSNVGDFDKFCKPGDVVAQDIVDEFENSMPPVTFHQNFIQSGEPYSHELDKEDNKFKATYTTFEKENGYWIYKGVCFKGKNRDTLNKNEKLNNNNFYIVCNLEDYTDNKLLIQTYGTISSIEKNGYYIAVDVSGEVTIVNKEGQYVPLYDEELKKAIYDDTFDKKYDVVNNNWLEISYFKQNENGKLEYQHCNEDVIYSIYELGNNEDEIKKTLEKYLEDFIKENEEEEVME